MVYEIILEKDNFNLPSKWFNGHDVSNLKYNCIFGKVYGTRCFSAMVEVGFMEKGAKLIMDPINRTITLDDKIKTHLGIGSDSKIGLFYKVLDDDTIFKILSEGNSKLYEDFLKKK